MDASSSVLLDAPSSCGGMLDLSPQTLMYLAYQATGLFMCVSDAA